MRIGLIADTHDRVPAIAALVDRMVAGGVGLILHAGDFCSPFSMTPILEARVALAGVFGRNDGDTEGLRAQAQKGMGAELYESPHSIDVGGERILLVHDLGEVSRRSVEAHRIVVHGCSHQEGLRERGDAVIVNPGEGCGWLYGSPSAAIIDLDDRKVEWLRLDGPEWKG
ncbi:MAG: metallophosphoesterase [Gemmatimonadaceae bacterium]